MNPSIHKSKKCILIPPFHRCHETKFLETPKPGIFSNKNNKVSFGTLKNVEVQEEKYKVEEETPIT